jgi:predicted O-linked N-acetylglucosamine transferase (SPINDLY family)
MQDLNRTFDRAAELQQKGDLAAAEVLYSELLKAQPDHFDGLRMFGYLRYQQGRLEEALSLMGSALKARPKLPMALLNYAVALDALRRFEEALSYYDRALALEPDYAEALYNRGIVLGNLRRPAEALASFDKLLAITPQDADALSHRGNALRSLKRPAEAAASYERALALRPRDPDLHNGLGNALRDLGRPAQALASYERALALKPAHVEALNNQGGALSQLGRTTEALASYDRVMALRPDDARVLYNRGNALQDLGRLEEALASYERALAIKSDYAEALNNRGNALQGLKREAEALASYEQALAIRPDYAEALNNRGNVMQGLKRSTEALASYERALAIKPDYAEAHFNRGNVLRDLNRSEEAIAGYDKALEIKADYVEALHNRGNAFQELNQLAQAMESFDRALAIKPKYADALNNRGLVLRELGRRPEAQLCFEKALAIEPDHRYAFFGVADAARAACDWPRATKVAGELEHRITRLDAVIPPFTLLGYDIDPGLQLECARVYMAEKAPAPMQPVRRRSLRDHDKLRIAYLSADFRKHVMAFVTADLFELHDRTRFETFGISLGADDGSEDRARLVRAFDQFIDVRRKADVDVARLLAELEIDIAVDLIGHTEGCRPRILAHRPAPIQVSYLGYAGTTGADFMDYVIADRIVLPFDQQPFYTEKIVHLPDCYHVNHPNRPMAELAPTRQQASLPEHGFVFCCFANSYKITSPVFEVWMRLLKAVDGGVLWLAQGDGAHLQNLRKEAAAQGIDPARIIFAGKVPFAEYFSRFLLADLFLDTLPYNSHATAADVLWTGLPLLTCTGSSFAGRVATSMLSAVGLPELATKGLAEYEALALRLATDPALLRSFRQRLEQNRATSALFDTDRFRHHLEAAYTTMWNLHQGGEKPQSFGVKPVG